MLIRGRRPAEAWLGALGMLAFAGAGVTAIAAVATGHPLVMSSFVLFAATAGMAVHRAHVEQAATPSAQPSSQSPRTFDDVAGMDEVRHELKELVDYIRNRDRYIELDAQLPRGIWLYGPPGTGKTLLAKALAAEAGASFHYASGSSFVEKWRGVAARARPVRKGPPFHPGQETAVRRRQPGRCVPTNPRTFGGAPGSFSQRSGPDDSKKWVKRDHSGRPRQRPRASCGGPDRSEPGDFDGGAAYGRLP